MRWVIALILLCPVLCKADIYRWVDEDGVVNYSDTAHPGAERVEIGEVQTTRFAVPAAPSGEASGSPSESGGTGSDGKAYTSVTIQRPQPEETLWNLEGMLDVQVAVKPSLRSGDRLTLYLDGQAVAGVPAGATSFTIDKVYRGMHTLRAAVRNQGGTELGSSPTITFFVQQTSVANPAAGPGPSPRTRPRG
jgi:hypothetical protein